MMYISTNCPPGSITYIIKPGDTLYLIAKRFNVSIPAIISANPFTNPNLLMIGQRICIPVKTCPRGSTYTIKPGDTIYNIAKNYNLTVDQIIKSNPGLNPNMVLIGQKICLPLISCPSDFISYSIKSEDTLYSLAKSYNTSVNAIQAANPSINANLLQIGSTICIPSGLEYYTNTDYKVSIFYPNNWAKVDDTHYEGIDGYFKIDAISSGENLEMVCENEANHQLNPYGTNPKIEKSLVGGNEACLIFPSKDQPAEMGNQAAVIIRYPTPISISGETYNYFILWSDNNHISSLAKVINFV